MKKKPKINWIINEIAKPISYGKRRAKTSVRGIVIHNTGNSGDTAKNNVWYFSKRAGTNMRSAGAHFFVDQEGKIGRSIPMNRSAYSVGNPGGTYAPGAFYEILNNSNTVSIELCDIMTKAPSQAMIRSVKILIKYIRAYCPNATEIVRHYDIVKKDCPHRFVADSAAWQTFRKEIDVWQ